MRRWIVRALLALRLLAAGVGSRAWWKVGDIGVERLTHDVYVLSGIGGNVGAVVPSAGIVVVDTITFPRQDNAILARIRDITDRPVVTIVDP
jgi:hypothetical protein